MICCSTSSQVMTFLGMPAGARWSGRCDATFWSLGGARHRCMTICLLDSVGLQSRRLSTDALIYVTMIDYASLDPSSALTHGHTLQSDTRLAIASRTQTPKGQYRNVPQPSSRRKSTSPISWVMAKSSVGALPESHGKIHISR